jgi:hypothetical protein
MVTSSEPVTTSFTVKFNVAVLSQFAVLVRFAVYVPAAVIVWPFQVYGSCVVQIVTSVVLVSVLLTVRFSVAMLSQFDVLVSVAV